MLPASAATKLTGEAVGTSIQPTMLVHEAYLKLNGTGQSNQWNGRAHFFGAAAHAMRRILIDHARRRKAEKRGGDLQRVDFVDAVVAADTDPIELLALDEALQLFEERWPEKANLVKLRYFTGLTIPEAAEALGISTANAERHWRFARAWLYGRMHGKHSEED